jgi:hypothetical protein
MADAKVYAEPGKNMTGKATAGITGGRLLKVSATKPTDGPTPVATAGATDAIFGVAGHDASSGDALLVIRGGVVGLRAGENISAGDKVTAGASGVVMKWVAAKAPTVTGNAESNVAVTTTEWIGTALADIANGADGPVALKI